QGVTNVGTVPSEAERNGDFRNSSLAAPRDPSTGQPFPDRIVPSSRFSSNGRALLSAYPLPNFAGPGGNYAVTGTNETHSREEVLRLDYMASPQTQVSYRFSHNDVQIFHPVQGGSLCLVSGTRPRVARSASFRARGRVRAGRPWAQSRRRCRTRCSIRRADRSRKTRSPRGRRTRRSGGWRSA